MLKKITLYLKDETVEALDKAANTDTYNKYPSEQAYSIFIDELVRAIQKPTISPCVLCCCAVPEHNHPPAWLFV
jgi:hypothetical protein